MHWAYVAGYFDGEGSVKFHQGSRKGKIRGLAWHNSDLQSLVAIQTFMDCGHMQRREKRGIGTKPTFILTVSNKKDLLRVGKRMLPYLLIKREKCKEMLDYVDLHVDATRSENHGKIVAFGVERLKERYAAGESFTQLARVIGVHPSAIALTFSRRGFQARLAGGAFMKGTKKNPATLRRMRAARRKMWADPEFRAKHIGILNAGRKRWHEARKQS